MNSDRYFPLAIVIDFVYANFLQQIVYITIQFVRMIIFNTQKKKTFYFSEARMNKFQEGLQQQRKLVEQLRLEAAVPRVRVSECIEDIMKYCEQHTSEDALINGFLTPGDNPYNEKGGCTIL